MGRPLAITKPIQRKLCEYVKDCVPLEVAAVAAGMNERTFWRYMQRGEEALKAWENADNIKKFERTEGKNEKVLRLFCQNVKKNNSDAQVSSMRSIKEGVDNWQSRAWILERRYPKKYGRRTYKPEEDIKDENINVTFNKPTTDPKAKGDSLIVERDK